MYTHIHTHIHTCLFSYNADDGREARPANSSRERDVHYENHIYLMHIRIYIYIIYTHTYTRTLTHICIHTTQMMDVKPDEPTAAEKEKGITKLRYMQFRESQSSSSMYGFRIEAVSGTCEFIWDTGHGIWDMTHSYGT